MNKKNFLELLKDEARLQAKLENKTIFPKKIGILLSVVARYPWQVLLITSFFTAIFINI